VHEAVRASSERSAPTRADDERLKTLERGPRELKRVNEIPRKASACVAAADRDRLTK